MNDPTKSSFLHIRERSLRGDLAPRGGCTIAFAQIDPSTLALAAAFCSDRDQFSKRIGREIARGRLSAGRWVETINLDPGRAYTGKERRDLVYKRVLNGQ